MNPQALISAIAASNDLVSIAREVGTTKQTLKGYLINLIRQSIDDENSDATVMPDDEDSDVTVMPDEDDDKDAVMIEDSFLESSEGYDTEEDDDEESRYERIIRNAPVTFSHEQLSFLNFAVRERKNMLLAAPAGCHAIDTKILMHDGSMKQVQDIKVGELLMGDDSTPRTVLKLIRGSDTMYRITNTRRESYVVNEGHILCLRYTNKKRMRYSERNAVYIVSWFCTTIARCKTRQFKSKHDAEQLFNSIVDNRTVEVSVKDLLTFPKTIQADLKEYKVAVDYLECNLPIDPYMIGYWLGDGLSDGSGITSQDSSVLKYFGNNLAQYRCYLRYRCNYTYGINGNGSGKKGSNYFISSLKRLGLIQNKHIPQIYKVNSRENRLKLLAGLIDADGNLAHDKCTFEFVQCAKHEQLIDDIIELARSLGFACNKRTKQTTWTHNGIKHAGDALRTTICGAGVEQIPTLCPRKQANPRRQIKDALVSGISIERLDKDNYYGFQVDSNHRYVMGSFTVTHNCGKSAVIETTMKLFDHMIKPHYLSWFRSIYGEHPSVAKLLDCPTYGLCASTGKAASLIGGRTLHSYLGIGLGRGSSEEWYARLSSAMYLRKTFENLRAVQVIIIDEISMISAEMLDKISEYLQTIRRNTEPFGGVQMIFVGDFAQLPPVNGRYAFKSEEYISANVQLHPLTKCFRQSDPVFVKILNEIRYGKCSDESYAILKAQTSIDELYSEGLKPMRLLSTNAEVDRVNEQELNKVCAETGCKPTSFPVKVMPGQMKKSETYRKADGIPDEVKLVVGAQVVVTYNLSTSVVNGSQGTVIAMSGNEIVVSIVGGTEVTIGYSPYKSPEDMNVFEAKTIFTFMPIKLGWASTIHKVQGMSLSLLEVDLSKVFCHGQTYTALSRCKSLGGLLVKGLSKRAFICDSIVKRFYGVE